MSRIHEALKKAAQEKNAQLADAGNTEVVDLTSEGLTATTAANRIRLDEMANRGESSPSEFFRFEEFVKRSAHPQWRIDPAASVFSAMNVDTVGAEKFRTLRSRLYQIAAAQTLRKLLITSTSPQEGKTFTVANLAWSFVRQPERRVLLIDADLRAPRLHMQFGAPKSPGLADYLRGDVDEYKAMQIGPEGNLCLIPAGVDVANPSELLHSERMKRLLDNMSRVFDWVILDSPPALALHDASILSDMCDGVLFVVRAGSTDFPMAEKATLEFRDKNLLGVVLNRADRSETYGSYYYGYSSYPPAGEKA
jgi:capsular exopolysaccharide synthesis family protein